jgi:hypothetical protein
MSEKTGCIACRVEKTPPPNSARGLGTGVAYLAGYLQGQVDAALKEMPIFCDEHAAIIQAFAESQGHEFIEATPPSGAAS